MAEVTDLWFYVQNTELAPVLDASDALFEQRSGMSRSDALDQHPSGGEWVDAWLSALQETVDDHRSSYYSRLTALAHGMPLESDPHQEISDADWRELCQRLLARYNQLESALHAWQFVYARTLVSLLWDSMVEVYPHTVGAFQEGGSLESDWADFRPLFQ